MLVLSRRQGENLMIGNNVMVTVLAVRGNHVRMGIVADPETTVLRQELYRNRLEGEQPIGPPAHATTA